jgi:excisionase family DNA binding protein
LTRTIRDLEAETGQPFTTTELAALLGVHVATVRRLIRSGELAGFRAGIRQVRIPYEAARTFIAGRVVQPR